MNTIKLLVADDHQLIIDGIVGLLESEHRFIVKGATDKQSIFAQLESFQPEVLLLDIGFRKKRSAEIVSGLDFAREIGPLYPQTKILILTVSYEESFVADAVNLGLSGYLIKNVGKAELVEAIETVAAGGRYFSQEVTDLMVNVLQKQNRPNFVAAQDALTLREIEVLKHLAQDLSAKEIAQQLNIAENTVNAHKKNMIEKLGVKSSLGLVRYAVENGIILSQ